MFRQSLKLFSIAVKNETKVIKFLVIAVLLEILTVALLYFLNGYYGSLYDGITKFDAHIIYSSIFKFAGIAGILVLIGGFSTYYINRLAFSIRVGLNTYYSNRYHVISHVENIEQRIQEDLRNFGERSCEFWFAVLKSLLKLPIFIGIVITLTQWWVGLILILAVIFGTWSTKVVAQKLIQLQAVQESNEASYRKGLINYIFKDFEQIKSTFELINRQIKKLSFLQSGLSQTFVLLPLVILMPLYLTKGITMGIMMQTANAMGRVIESLTVLIEQRQLIVNISTCLKRMETLETSDKDDNVTDMELVRMNHANGQMVWKKKA